MSVKRTKQLGNSEVNPPELDINPTWGFTMSKYTVETKLKSIELYKNNLESRQVQHELNISSQSTSDG